MIVVGMVSTYREGRLARAAILSALRVELDCLYVFEGPAGDPLPNEAELPETWLPSGTLYVNNDGTTENRCRVVVHRGRWRTDARKRNEMLQRAKNDYPGEKIWAVVVDADEVLVGAEYLRDRLDWIDANDERKGASVATADNPPMMRWPLRLIETDGAISFIGARVFRADLLRSIDHSSSVVTNIAGVQDGWGNVAEISGFWLEQWMSAVDKGKMIAWPPFPAEPCLVHRSNLRHPGRSGLRMSDQEQSEFAKAQAAEAQARRVQGAEPLPHFQDATTATEFSPEVEAQLDELRASLPQGRKPTDVVGSPHFEPGVEPIA